MTARNISLLNATYSGVPAVQLPISGGGTATFTEVTDTTATASDVATGKYFYTSAGVKTQGTNSGGAPTLQNKSVSPTTTQQTIQADEGYDGLDTVTVDAMPTGKLETPSLSQSAIVDHKITLTPLAWVNNAGYIGVTTKSGAGFTVHAYDLVSGSETKTQNGTYDVTNLEELVVNVSGGSSKNVQLVQNNSTRITSTAYTKACGTITVSKSGTYDIYWCAYRTSSSGNWGTQWYKNGTAQGSVQSFSSYYQAIHLTNISLEEDDKIDVYGQSRGGYYYLYVGQLTIIEV